MFQAISKLTADARFCFVALLLLALTTISAPIVVTALVEGATRKQCMNRDWPADQHATHMTFCETYGYPTK